MGLYPILALMPDGSDRKLALVNAERGLGLAELNVSWGLGSNGTESTVKESILGPLE